MVNVQLLPCTMLSSIADEVFPILIACERLCLEQEYDISSGCVRSGSYGVALRISSRSVRTYRSLKSGVILNRTFFHQSPPSHLAKMSHLQDAAIQLGETIRTSSDYNPHLRLVLQTNGLVS